jgi:hypothetical protein
MPVDIDDIHFKIIGLIDECAALVCVHLADQTIKALLQRSLVMSADFASEFGHEGVEP